ncbi:MAG: hypothetical protein ACYTKD_26250 [Planctomycetota bacterium]|jgi:hypothetical protein
MSGIAPRYAVTVEGRDVSEDISADALSVSFEVDARIEGLKLIVEDDRIEPETFKTICTKRWGPKRVVADPNDPKSRERAIAEGYAIGAKGAYVAGCSYVGSPSSSAGESRRAS